MKNKFNLLKKYSRKSIILFIVLIILLGGIGYGLAQYQNISELTDKAQKFKEQKQYEKAIEKLESAKSNLLVRGLKIKKEEINNKIQENKDLLHKTKKQQTEPDNLNKKEEEKQQTEKIGKKIGGVISSNTTLNPKNNPYVVTKSILVKKGVILTIEPGTRIEFQASPEGINSKYSIEVKGTLIAKGEEDKKIIFTNRGSGKWGGIYFPDIEDENLNLPQKKSNISYCVFENGGGNYKNALIGKTLLSIGVNNSIVVDNNIFKSADNFSLLSRANSEITNNKFYNRVFIQGGAPYFHNNLAGEGLIISGRGNVFPTITRNEITSNKNKAGIRFDSGMYGGGDCKEGPVIKYNDITNNQYGVWFNDYRIIDKKRPIFEFNNIYDNDFAVKLEETKTNFNFPNNWWGTADSSEIETLIYDYEDDFNL